MIEILIYLFLCLGATLLLEAIPLLCTTNKKDWWKASVVCNVITNPVLNLVVMLLNLAMWGMNRLPALIALEIVVVLAEAYFYQRMLDKKYWRCLLFSFAANFISFIGGLALLSFTL